MRHRLMVRALLVGALAGLVLVPGAVSAGNGNGNADTRPGFLTGPARGTPLDVAVDYLRATKAQSGLTGGDLNDLVANLAAKANGHVPHTSAADAARSAGRHLGLKAAERAAAESGARLVYQPTAGGAVRLAWELHVRQADGDH